jgi:hypothetical protein
MIPMFVPLTHVMLKLVANMLKLTVVTTACVQPTIVTL